MSRIDRIHVDIPYGTTVGKLMSTLQEVASYDKDATVGLSSDSELNFDVNKDLELKDD